MTAEKVYVLLIFIACYALALTRKVKIAYASVGASLVLLLFGFVSIEDALLRAIKWDVLGIYWGFMMLSFVFMKSRMPELLANLILLKVRKERYVILALSSITAFLSAFMENVGVVLIMAPVAIEIAKRLNSSLFHYLISIAISSNVVTTVTMVADPPSIILALETGLKPLDFYWFQGRPGLGTMTIIGVVVALLTLVAQFWRLDKEIVIKFQKIEVKYGASYLFVGGVTALFLAPVFGVSVGVVGLTVGIISLYMGRAYLKEMFLEFDWNSFFFIIGIFVVIFSLNSTGLLRDFTGILVQQGLKEPSLVLAIITWLSVAFSSFMDNVPYTVLMIPVCQHLAELIGISAWPLLFGMIVGTGTGGNITPVGAAANVFACGILEKHGYKISLVDYLKIGIPFSVSAVATIHVLIEIFWMR